MSLIYVPSQRCLARRFGEFGFDPLNDGLGQKGGDISAQAGDFLD